MSWNKLLPGNVKMRVGRQQLLSNNDALETALNRDHNFPGTPEADDGEHTKITLHAPIATPTNQADKGFIYLKDVDGKAELFFLDEDNHEIQMTTGGAINPVGTVLLAGAQTITGTKTLSGANIVMAGAETVDGVDISAHKAGTAASQHTAGVGKHAHNADTEAAGGLLNNLFGSWVSKSNNTAYKADTDGIVCAFGNSDNDNKYNMGYTDSNNPPATLRIRAFGGPGNNYGGFTMPVKKGDYWKVETTDSVALIVYWIPIGG